MSAILLRKRTCSPTPGSEGSSKGTRLPAVTSSLDSAAEEAVVGVLAVHRLLVARVATPQNACQCLRSGAPLLWHCPRRSRPWLRPYRACWTCLKARTTASPRRRVTLSPGSALKLSAASSLHLPYSPPLRCLLPPCPHQEEKVLAFWDEIDAFKTQLKLTEGQPECVQPCFPLLSPL